MYMRLEFYYFMRQLAEIEERSTCTHIMASYFKHSDLSRYLHDPVNLNY